MPSAEDMDTLSSVASPAPSTTSLPPPKTLKHDDYFYFRCLVFEVEDTLFKVPRYGLPGEGAAFDAMFSRNPGAPGSSDDDPICIDADVTASDFRSLLKASYPPPGTLSAQLDIDEWMGVLKLAKKWDLTELRDKAVQQSDVHIQQKSSVEKILLARQYGVSAWLDQAYLDLVSREQALTAEEIGKVGWETFGRLMLVRERGLKSRVPAQAPKSTVKCSRCASTTPYCGSCYSNTCCVYNVEVVISPDVSVPSFDYAAAVKDIFQDVVA